MVGRIRFEAGIRDRIRDFIEELIETEPPAVQS